MTQHYSLRIQVSYLIDQGPLIFEPAYLVCNCNSLDRVYNLIGYSATNCRWATDKEQARNRRTTKLITIGEKKIYG